MTMVLTASEVEAIRFHLGYGNINVGAYPYTPDGFYELFTDVVAANLSTGAETTATANKVFTTIERPLFVRPNLTTAGTGATVVVTALLRRTNSMRT